MKLPQGITGFYGNRPGEKPPRINQKQLKQTLYNLEIGTNYKFLEWQKPDPGTNYLRVIIQQYRPDKQWHLLFNAQYPCYCAVAAAEEPSSAPFVELDPDIKSRIGRTFRFLSPAELNKSVTPEDLEGLNEVERDQVKSWRSTTVREIVFNEYD